VKKRLLIVGAKGSGEIAMSTFEAVNQVTDEWVIEGYLNDVVPKGQYFGHHKVLGGSDEISDWVEKGYHIHYTLHFNAKLKAQRVEVFERLQLPDECQASAIHPLAYRNPESIIGAGCLMLPFSATSVGVHVSNNCHMYTSSFLGHDCQVASYTTIGAHSIVGGRVRLDRGVHVGLNSSIREDITVGEYAIIGMGSVVVKNIEAFETHVGNPARPINK
jgi:acetyltransferase EpsM